MKETKDSDLDQDQDGAQVKQDTENDQDGNEPPFLSLGYNKDRSMWHRMRLPLFGGIRFNPIVAILSLTMIMVFVLLCLIKAEDVPFDEWKREVVDHFSWLYVAAMNGWAVFLVVLYFSKYGDVKMGKPEDKIEFNNASWFTMLFACGIGVGLFFYGVAEPIYHYTGDNRFTADFSTPDNTLAQTAISLTVFHWTINGWVVYSVVGLLLGLLAHREGLPLTMKSCLYPLIKDHIFGWMGDVIDAVSILSTLFGVCTSLGLGTRQLNSGFSVVFPGDMPADDLTFQIVILWVIMAIATASTVSGVGMGIRRLSEICFISGVFLMVTVMLMGHFTFILNLLVQTVGYFVTSFPQLVFHTDAFERLGPSHGSEDRNRFFPDDIKLRDGPSDWIDGWTMFYWGWWVSWCPFVGMFIAKISKGRTIRQFLNGTLSAPVIFVFFWMVIFGGSAIRQERTSAGLGYCCKDPSGWFVDVTSLENRMEADGLHSLLISSHFDRGDNKSLSWMCEGPKCGDCAESTLEARAKKNATFGDLLHEYKVLRFDFGSTSEDRTVVRMSCHPTEQMWFDLMRSYKKVGYFLAFFSIFGIILYFITSADSGSLVLDCLASNGMEDPPKIQRVFWAFTEGACATALLVVGGKKALSALQSVGICSGFPYIFILCATCVSIWKTVKVSKGEIDHNSPGFEVSVLDQLGATPYFRAERKTMLLLFGKFVINIVLAPWTLAKSAAALKVLKQKKPNVVVHAIFSNALALLALLFFILTPVIEGSWAIGFFWYFSFVGYTSVIRSRVRAFANISGNYAEDLLASTLLYPAVAVQLEIELAGLKKKKSTPGDSKLTA